MFCRISAVKSFQNSLKNTCNGVLFSRELLVLGSLTSSTNDTMASVFPLIFQNIFEFFKTSPAGCFCLESILLTEAAFRGSVIKKLFRKSSQNSQENTLTLLKTLESFTGVFLRIL